MRFDNDAFLSTGSGQVDNGVPCGSIAGSSLAVYKVSVDCGLIRIQFGMPIGCFQREQNQVTNRVLQTTDCQIGCLTPRIWTRASYRSGFMAVRCQIRFGRENHASILDVVSKLAECILSPTKPPEES